EVAAVRAHHGALQMREDRVRRKLEEQEHAAIEVQGVAARYEMVKKDAETARALHDSLLKQQMDTTVNSELAPSNIRIVERAEDLVVLHEPRSVVAEAFRSLRTAVLFSAPGAPPRVILLTSAGVGEGKTFTSLNLATTLADSGSRVLLIDADLRRAGCHRAFGIVNERGLSSFLAGQVTLAEAIRVLDAPKLSFIPAGPTPPNPAELVGSARMRDTLEQLRDEYDFVIIDSPPTLPVTDAVVLAREAD